MNSKVLPAAKARPKPPNAGKGRKKGVPNKVTQTAKEAIAMLADGMTGELQNWLRASAYGIGHAWVNWDKPEDWDGTYPPGARVSNRGKLVQVPVLDKKGLPRVFTLHDVMAGQMPLSAQIDWIVKPQPGSTTDTMLRALEYHIPKLSRSEVTGEGGTPLVPATINIVGVKAPKRE